MAPGKSKYKILPPKLPEPTLNVGECVEEMKRRVDHWDQGCVKDPTVRTVRWGSKIDLRHVTKLKMEDVDLEILSQREKGEPRTMIAIKESERLTADKGWLFINRSCYIVDKNDTPLVAYMSEYDIHKRGKKELIEGKDGKQPATSLLQTAREHRLWGGILDYIQWHLQAYYSKYPPEFPKADSRHGEPPFMEFMMERGVVEIEDDEDAGQSDEEHEDEDGDESDEEDEADYHSEERDKCIGRLEKEGVDNLDVERGKPQDAPLITMEEYDRLGEGVRKACTISGVYSDETPNAQHIEGQGHKFEMVREGNGVSHFVHAWAGTGHRNPDHLVASKDLLSGTATKQGAVMKLLSKISFIHTIFAYYMSLAFPTEHREMTAFYQAGKWWQHDSGSGCFGALAVVWKCLVRIHRDTQDGPKSVCGITNGGAYLSPQEGKRHSNLLLPDLRIQLRYQPGDMVLLRSADLYHGLKGWKAAPMMNSDRLTPGRWAFAFFYPEIAKNWARGKMAGDGLKTGHSNEGGFKTETSRQRKRKRGIERSKISQA